MQSALDITQLLQDIVEAITSGSKSMKDTINEQLVKQFQPPPSQQKQSLKDIVIHLQQNNLLPSNIHVCLYCKEFGHKCGSCPRLTSKLLESYNLVTGKSYNTIVELANEHYKSSNENSQCLKEIDFHELLPKEIHVCLYCYGLGHKVDICPSLTDVCMVNYNLIMKNSPIESLLSDSDDDSIETASDDEQDAVTESKSSVNDNIEEEEKTPLDKNESTSDKDKTFASSLRFDGISSTDPAPGATATNSSPSDTSLKISTPFPTDVKKKESNVSIAGATSFTSISQNIPSQARSVQNSSPEIGSSELAEFKQNFKTSIAAKSCQPPFSDTDHSNSNSKSGADILKPIKSLQKLSTDPLESYFEFLAPRNELPSASVMRVIRHKQYLRSLGTDCPGPIRTSFPCKPKRVSADNWLNISGYPIIYSSVAEFSFTPLKFTHHRLPEMCRPSCQRLCHFPQGNLTIETFDVNRLPLDVNVYIDVHRTDSVVYSVISKRDLETAGVVVTETDNSVVVTRKIGGKVLFTFRRKNENGHFFLVHE